jgi:hypothetical protein
MAFYGTSGFGWVSLIEDKAARADAQQFDLLGGRSGLSARDLIAKVSVVGKGIIDFSKTQKMKVPKDPKEHSWRPGALLVAKMLSSRATSPVNDDQRGELIRQMLIFIYMAEFVAVRPGTDDFEYADRVFVKAGTGEIVTPDYHGKTQTRYVVRGTKGPFVRVDQVYIGFVRNGMNDLLRLKAVSVRELTAAARKKAMAEALGPLFPYADALGEAIRMLPRSSSETIQLFRGAKMSKASEAALRACVGGVVAFPMFTSFSGGMNAPRKFPVSVSGPDEVEVIFSLSCQGCHRVGSFAADEVQGREEILFDRSCRCHWNRSLRRRGGRCSVCPMWGLLPGSQLR